MRYKNKLVDVYNTQLYCNCIGHISTIVFVFLFVLMFNIVYIKNDNRDKNGKLKKNAIEKYADSTSQLIEKYTQC